MDQITKISLVGIALQLILMYAGFSFAENSPAVPLLQYDPENEKFVLNETGLDILRGLSHPIQVISAIGDARVGKSTSLNIIQHVLQQGDPKQYSEVFVTGDTVMAVTRGVWISVHRDINSGMERVLLDVEGTDLGDDTITDHLSIFTALMSSGMTFFMRGLVKTHSLDFLFRVSRLSDVMFKDDTIKNFPQLRVVLRGALQTPGVQVRDYVRNELTGSSLKDSSSKKRKAIAKHFPRENIEVTTIEDLENPIISKDFDRLSKTKYMETMQVLADDVKQFPVKKTLKGGLMDGKTLAELSLKLVEAMANNSWPDFGNVYLMIEKHLCDRRYTELVEPQLGGNAQSIKQFLSSGFGRFEKDCALKDYVLYTKTELTRIMETKEELEKKQKELEEETERRKEEEKKRIKAEEDFKEDKEKMKGDLQKEKEQRAKFEEETERLRHQNAQRQNNINQLQAQLRHSEARLERLRDSDGNVFLNLIKGLVDTFVNIIRIPMDIAGN